MPILKTFVQISDLHLGHVDPSKLAATHGSLAPASWAINKRFQGFMGHHYPALQQLAELFNKKLANEHPELIVTGDLTSCGHPDQFELARDFLGGKLAPPRGRDGLGVLTWQKLTISGNHDQWPGTNAILGPPSPALRKHVLLSDVEDFPGLPDGRVLRMIRLDTDFDVGHRSWARFMAQGEFTSLLTPLANRLGPPTTAEIRVLLLHHSRLYGTPGLFHTLVMNANSRSALDDFLVDHNIRVMLCGHTHAAIVKRHQARHGGGQRLNVLECCCGTTTQCETVPYPWKNFFGNRPTSTLTANTLLVHRLIKEDDAWFWAVEKMVRINTGFIAQGRTITPMRV